MDWWWVGTDFKGCPRFIWRIKTIRQQPQSTLNLPKLKRQIYAIAQSRDHSVSHTQRHLMLHLLLIEWGENMQMQIGKPIFHEEISASAWRYWERLNFRSRPRQEVEWSSNSIWRSRRSSGADREEWIVNKQRRISLQGGERRLNRLWTWLWNGSRIYGLKS